MVATHSRNGYASVDDLLAAAPLAEQDHTLSTGAKVKFRKMSRRAQMAIRAYAQNPDYDDARGERLLLSFCLVAIPPFDGPEDERLLAMQEEMDPEVLDELSHACLAYTRPSKEVTAATTATFPRQPGDELRVLPDEGAGVEVG